MLNLTAGLDYKFGGKILSYSNYYLVGNGLTKETLHGRTKEYGGLEWTDSDGNQRQDGMILDGVAPDGSKNQKMTFAQAYYSSFIHDNSRGWQPDNFKKNDYIKLRELAIGYTVPKHISDMLKIQKLSLTLTARNLFYLYKTIDNVDVESVLGSSGNNSWIENSNYPSVRSYGFRINFSF